MSARAPTLPLRPPMRARSLPIEGGLDARATQLTVAYILLHIPLGYLIKSSPWIATAHALVVLFVAFATAAETRHPSRLLPIMGYIVVSESLWRTGRAMVFHETAKYALAGVAIIGMLRFYRYKRVNTTPVVYFALLLPSIASMPVFDRSDVSFNLSGPFSLAATTFFLCGFRLTPLALRQTLTALLGPVVSLVTVATFSTLTTEDINFYATKVASGGLGQNQASSLFGLGALAAFLYLSLLRRNQVLTVLFGLVGVWSAAQAALTFSRGGLATTAGAGAAATFFLSLDRRSRGVAMLRLLMVLVVAAVVVVPVLSNITGGAVKDRFSDSGLTGRDKIIRADLDVFLENPILGVGPGQSYDLHARTFRSSSAHTEYSRLLSEHGIFGLVALLLLCLMSYQAVREKTSTKSRALAVALATWAVLYMFHAAMRMAAVSFVFALASMTLIEDPSQRVERQSRAPRRAAD